MTAKNALVANTPRKLPFQDTTNQSEAIKTLAAGFKSDQSQFKKIQLQEEARKLSYEEEDDDGDWFEQFAYPADKDCKCCGKEQGHITHYNLESINTQNESFLSDIQSDSSFECPSPLLVPMDENLFFFCSPSKIRVPSPVSYIEIPLPYIESENDAIEEMQERLDNIKFSAADDSGISHDDNSLSTSMVIPRPPFYSELSDDDDVYDNSMISLDNSIISKW